jgi:hypothetical protein
MIKRMSRYLGMFGLVLITVIVVAWLTSSDPKLNQASFEKTPLVEGLAPLKPAGSGSLKRINTHDSEQH